MISINKNIQSEILMTTMEELVPKDSLFRKVDKYIDFTFIYDEVKDLYSENNGRPSIDPVVLFKLIFIQTLEGIKSMRQTCKKIKVDAEYRWFLGIPFGHDTPHFSTFSKNYERRFKDSDVFENIFKNIIRQAIKYKLVEGETLYTDSTHKKANANKNKYEEVIEKETGEVLEYTGYINKQGYKKNQNYTWLICAAQNMKNIAIKKDNIDSNMSMYNALLVKIQNFWKIFKRITLKTFALENP